MTVDSLDIADLLAHAPFEEWSGMLSDTIRGHIHLHFAHISQSEQFDSEGLDFEVDCRYGGQALFMSSGKYHHHMWLNPW